MLITFALWVAVLCLGGLTLVTGYYLIDALTSGKSGRACRAIGLAATWEAFVTVVALALALPGSQSHTVGAIIVCAALAITSLALIVTAPQPGGPARVLADAGHVLKASVGGIGDWARSKRKPGPGSSAGPGAGPGPGGPPPERDIPPVADDPELDHAIQPTDVLEGTAVPPDRAQAASRVAGFEPDTNADFATFLHREAAGDLAEADAWESLAENIGDGGVGLDPAVLAAAYEVAQHKAEAARFTLLVWQRYRVIYDEIEAWVDGGGRLPHQARRWFGDGTAA